MVSSDKQRLIALKLGVALAVLHSAGVVEQGSPPPPPNVGIGGGTLPPNS